MIRRFKRIIIAIAMECSTAYCRDVALRYLSMQPLHTYRDLIVQYTNSCQGPEEQRHMLTETIHNPLCSKYPISTPYKCAFLKVIMKALEDSRSDISEEMYKTYTSCLSQTSDDQSMCYKHYITNIRESQSANVHIVLKESTLLVSDGTTGLCTWPAAMCLAEWLLENLHILQQRNVVELGCGLGFAGIAAIKACRPRFYHFTDCHHAVLSLLKENIQLNDNTIKHKQESWEQVWYGGSDEIPSWKLQNDEAFKSKFKDSVETGCEVYVTHLDWEESSRNAVAQLPCDVVLAADVVYDATIIPPLIKVLGTLLSTQPDAVGYMASTVRNQDTMKLFKKACNEANIMSTPLQGPLNKLWIYDRTVPIEIIQLQCKR